MGATPLDTAVVIERLSNKRIELVGAYVGSVNVKQKLRCTMCGKEWEARLSNVFTKTGCPECSKEVNATKKRLPVSVVDSRLKEKGFRRIGDYRSGNVPTKIEHVACGYVWEPYVQHIIGKDPRRGIGCPKCSGVARSTIDDVVRGLQDKGFELVGGYTGSKTDAHTIRDTHCGYEWVTSLSHILRRDGSGCPRCAGTAVLTEEDVKIRLTGKGYSLVEPYHTSAHTPHLIKHTVCGHEWMARPNNIFSGMGCPQCARKDMGRRRAIPHDVVIGRMRDRGYEFVDGFSGTLKDPQRVRHLKCGYEWNAAPSNVFGKSEYCPVCSRETAADKIAVSVEEADRRLFEMGMSRVGEYVGRVTKKQRVRHDACGHEWEAAITNIKGCNHCRMDRWGEQGIYNLDHAEVSYAYIGVSSKPMVRLEEHQQDLGERGELARLIEIPYELSYADVLPLYEVAWEESRIPEQVSNWFESNPHGTLPPGRLWFVDWFNLSDKEKCKPARVPRFVAEWVETEMIYQLSENFPADNPFLRAGKVRLVNIAKNSPAALSC